MALGKVSVVGGQVNYSKMTNDLSAADYAFVKSHVWLMMLKDNMKPMKWLKANRFGTKVNFEPIKSQEAAEAALTEFEGYLNEANKEYGFGLVLGD